jgi:hypothetical protein
LKLRVSIGLRDQGEPLKNEGGGGGWMNQVLGRKASYIPSLAGILTGKKQSKRSREGLFSGIEIRGI